MFIEGCPGFPGDGGGEDSLPAEEGAWLFGHSKDHRDDLPQVVIAMAVTQDGIPVRCWTFTGNTGGGHYIHAENLRNTNAEAAAALARPGRYRGVAGNLRVKEVWVPAPG